MGLILKISTNFDLCTGCQICQLACSEKKVGGYNHRHGLLKITKKNEGLVTEPVVCNHCSNAYCQTVCPVDAIGKDEGTGAVIIDREKCIGCGLCIEYCPLCFWDQDNEKAVKCDLCRGDPHCVKECPTGALELAKVKDDKDLELIETGG